MTPPQLRALLWLSANGEWSGKLTADIAPAIDSLRLYHPEMVEIRTGRFGRPGHRGRSIRQARLTAAGIAERRFRERETT